MVANIYIIPIEKQIISALEIAFPPSIALLKRELWRKTFGPISTLMRKHFTRCYWWANVVCLPQSPSMIVGEFWWVPSFDEFLVRHWLNWVWISCRSRSIMCPQSTTGKRIDWLYRRFSFSVSYSNARIWLSSLSIVCRPFEFYLRWRSIWKCW